LLAQARLVGVAADQHRDIHLFAFGENLCRLFWNYPAIDDRAETDLPILPPSLENFLSGGIPGVTGVSRGVSR